MSPSEPFKPYAPSRSKGEPFDAYALPSDAIEAPPQRLWPALRKIGPGIILAASIVGSGELILTTSLGAKYGFVFLWLILFSCVIKVFVQLELGRYAISSGKPTLAALNDLPGPRLGAHWMVWWWFIMLLATVFQLAPWSAAWVKLLIWRFLAFRSGSLSDLKASGQLCPTPFWSGRNILGPY
jgi:hypothetical protein